MHSLTFWLLHTGFFCPALGCLSSCGTWASRHVSAGPTHRGSVAGLLALKHAGFISSCGAWADLLLSMWDLPGQGTKPVSPASAGGFSPTLPPEDDILSEDLKEDVRKEARWLSERLRQRAACSRASFMWP